MHSQSGNVYPFSTRLHLVQPGNDVNFRKFGTLLSIFRRGTSTTTRCQFICTEKKYSEIVLRKKIERQLILLKNYFTIINFIPPPPPPPPEKDNWGGKGF